MKAVLISTQDGRVVADKAWCTEGVTERVEGWFSRKSVEIGEGLLIAPCSSVHSFGMNFSFDLLFLDEGMRVIKLKPGFKPNRVTWAGAKAMLTPWKIQALELPRGAAEGISKGDCLVLSERAA